MKLHSNTLLWLFLIAPLFGAPTLFAETRSENSPFEAGLAAYEAGDYATARQHFEEALAVEETPAVRHNLALAHFRLGQESEAVWQLERARLLDPFNADYLAKRAALRNALGLPGDAPEWYELAGHGLTLNGWLLAATAACWLLLAALCLPRISGLRAGLGLQLTRFGCAAILLIALPGIWLSLQRHQSGILVSEAPAVALRAAPASAAPQMGSARPGERARLTDRYRGFVEIETENQFKGWVPSETFRELTLQEP